jgi:hypothetical protein
MDNAFQVTFAKKPKLIPLNLEILEAGAQAVRVLEMVTKRRGFCGSTRGREWTCTILCNSPFLEIRFGQSYFLNFWEDSWKLADSLFTSIVNI